MATTAFARLITALFAWIAAIGLSGAAAWAQEPEAAPSDELPVVRVGLLRFGTVNWELDTLRHHGFGEARGVRVDTVPLASKSALTLALQAGEIDLMVGDWLWVVGERQRGGEYSFVPYSTAVGSLIVREGAGIERLRDLRGQRVGISGGPNDKNWILLRAYARRALREDLRGVTDQMFAPPPLLNDLLERGQIDLAITNWNYAVRLQSRGFRALVRVQDVLPELGIAEPIPLLGWVFREEWASAHAEDLKAFIEASYAAKRLLASSDEEWTRLQPKLGLGIVEAQLDELREGYRAGIPRRFGEAERAAVGRALAVLVDEAGARALGLESDTLPEGTFWQGFALGEDTGSP
ncbi:MAG: ABC transporter substrate-binding protein [Pseudomonadota bacterium]